MLKNYLPIRVFTNDLVLKALSSTNSSIFNLVSSANAVIITMKNESKSNEDKIVYEKEFLIYSPVNKALDNSLNTNSFYEKLNNKFGFKPSHVITEGEFFFKDENKKELFLSRLYHNNVSYYALRHGFLANTSFVEGWSPKGGFTKSLD